MNNMTNKYGSLLGSIFDIEFYDKNRSYKVGDAIFFKTQNVRLCPRCSCEMFINKYNEEHCNRCHKTISRKNV